MQQGGALQAVPSERCSISKKAIGRWRLGEKLTTSRGEDDDDKTLGSPVLARQKYREKRTDFTTLLLHNYKSKSDCEDYRKNQPASLTCLALL
jgi:hypothetical protein